MRKGDLLMILIVINLHYFNSDCNKLKALQCEHFLVLCFVWIVPRYFGIYFLSLVVLIFNFSSGNSLGYALGLMYDVMQDNVSKLVL